MPIEIADMVRRLNTETYEGDEKDGYAHGKGVYRFSNGIIYSGNMYEGAFDGKGTIAFPKGGKFVANWRDGTLNKGTYYYADNLEYNTDNWLYATDADRRFWTGIQYGIKLQEKPQLTDKVPSVWIPEGTYDTGDGYFNPDGKIVRYTGIADHTATPEEANWASRKCRIGVPEELENQPVPQEPVYALPAFKEIPFTTEDEATFGVFEEYLSESEEEESEDEEEETALVVEERPTSATSVASAAVSLVNGVLGGLEGDSECATERAERPDSAALSLVNGVLGQIERDGEMTERSAVSVQSSVSQDDNTARQAGESFGADQFVDSIIEEALSLAEQQMTEDEAARHLRNIAKGMEDRARIAELRAKRAEREQAAKT